MAGEIRHTPGPWSVEGWPDNQIVWSSDRNRVCFMAHSNGKDVARDVATGHLIAAAPDLLAALKGLLPLCVNPHDGGEFEAGEIPAVDAARAAIAKAEG